MHVFVADGEIEEVPRPLIERPAKLVLLPGQHVGEIAEGAGAVGQVELPARGVSDGAGIPKPVAALDQRRPAMGMTKRPVFMEPADMADLPQHGIDDVELRSHQFRR